MTKKKQLLNTIQRYNNAMQKSEGVSKDAGPDNGLSEKSTDSINKKCFAGGTCCPIIGLSLLVVGISTCIYTPFQLLLDERLRMMPGFPPFDWWKDPPDEVLCKFHLFNITNSEAFLNGTDSKLNVHDIGPVVYLEKLVHSKVYFNENKTMTYTATRNLIYLPELNTIDLNATLYIPNLGVLFIPSYFHDASFFTKMAINVLIRQLDSQPIMKTTVYNALWNVSDPIMDVAQKIAPFMVPTRNMAYLSMIYKNFSNTLTVYTGKKYGHSKFFGIDKFDGSSYIPHYQDSCKLLVTNSTEGVCYPQFLNNNSTLLYWRKTICKVVKLHYQDDYEWDSIAAKKFILSPDTFDRTYPLHKDCHKGSPILPNGITDVSPCYYGAPLGASFPHFMYGDQSLKDSVTGLEPSEDLHNSYVILEPTNGIPLEGRARSQSNLIVNRLRGFNQRVQKFSGLFVPLFWLEYHQVGIPYYVKYLIIFVIEVVPILQVVISFLLISSGILVLYLCRRRRLCRKRFLTQNSTLQFETELFIKG